MGNIICIKINYDMYLLNKVEVNWLIIKNKYEIVLKSFYFYYDEGKKGE